MARVRIERNSAGYEELLKHPGIREVLAKNAERVAQIARANAPVVTGRYRDSIEVESRTTDRAVERVVARAPHSHLVESRTGNLAKALGQAGG